MVTRQSAAGVSQTGLSVTQRLILQARCRQHPKQQAGGLRYVALSRLRVRVSSEPHVPSHRQRTDGGAIKTRPCRTESLKTGGIWLLTCYNSCVPLNQYEADSVLSATGGVFVFSVR